MACAKKSIESKSFFKPLILFAGVFGSVALGGCAPTVGMGGNGTAVERWHNFDPGQVHGVKENEASVVFLREKDAIAGKSVNVFVNGEYLASLLSGGFKQSIACVGNNRLTAHYTDVRSRYHEKERQGQMFDVPAGKVSYFRVVTDAQGKPALQALDGKAGQAAVDALKEQVHTLPRVENRLVCAKPVVAQFKKFTLDASALFAFDKSDYANLLPQGKQEIRKVAEEIAQSRANIDRIEVTGYTDPEGSDAYNLALSRDRANTVKQALLESKLPASAISAHGKGEQDLVVTDCRVRFPKNRAQLNLCNQPNRRVEIVLFGANAVSK